MGRDTRKALKRGKNEKRKVQEKFNNVTTTIKFFNFDFLFMETDIFCLKTVRENVTYVITFLVKFCLVLHNI